MAGAALDRAEGAFKQPRPKSRFRPSEETRAGWLVISPWIIGFIVFTMFPFVASLYFSFTEYDVISSPQWVGLENYDRLLTRDRLFPVALRNTFLYTVMYVPLHLATALAVALLLNEARKLKGVYRTAFYLPSMTPAVATAYLWVWMLNPNDGLVNRTLRALNLPAPAWTVDPDWTKPTIVISQVWMMGGAMILFLAALQGVPKDLYEAATIDGAGAWRRFRVDSRRFTRIPISQSTLIRAVGLAARSAIVLRTLDAIQLQCALDAGRAATRRGGEPLIFVAADTRLLDAARALWLETANPLDSA